MKKIICCLMTVMLCFGALALTGCTPREEILKIYNWGEYMYEGAVADFENWYKEETGKNITVQYDEFDTNESMYTQIGVRQRDYDLVCPSDYMVERMIKEDLLLEIDTDIVNIADETVFDQSIINLVKAFDVDSKYAYPYLWGTFGILYDTNAITSAEDRAKLESWTALWDEEFSGKISMKDSYRDAFAVAGIYSNREELARLSNNFSDYGSAYSDRLQQIFDDSSDNAIAAAKSALTAQKSLINKYEVDNGKDEIGIEDNYSIGFFWNCDAGYTFIELENKDLYFTVPKEGSNVWVDAFVIPKFAKNVTAANYFLKFLSQTETAVKNMEYAGSATAIAPAVEEYKEILEADEDGFFDDTYEATDGFMSFKDMYISALFPNAEVLSRCAVMKDFGDRNDAVSQMWLEIRSAA